MMADWRTYAKAARNTARKQAPDLARQARDSASRGSHRARDYARAAGRAVDGGTRESRERVRKDAAAYTVVAGRHLRRARIGTRVARALRDAVIMGLSLLVFWFVITRTGVQIPISAVLVVVLLLMVLRFGWALFASPRDDGITDEELDEYDLHRERYREEYEDRDEHESREHRERDLRRG
ncbi:MAG: hypothetical protein Q4G40_10935 [Brachybacterium sp.]|nr:hypothetical protein [Brachybacterium sp.]